VGQGAWFALVHCARFAVAQETRFFYFTGRGLLSQKAIAVVQEWAL